MPVPTDTISPSRQSQAYAPPSGGSTTDMLKYEHLRAYLLHPNPGLVEVVQVTDKYAEVLGIEAGDYVVPDLVTVLAVPGANGVRGLSDWSIERLLSTKEGGGFHEIAKHLAMKGTPLLDPFETLPREFLPAGVPDGGYLRYTVTEHNGGAGRCNHLAFEWLEGDGIDEIAELKIDRAAWSAWRVWLVQTGKTPEVNAAAIRREKRSLQARVARIKGQPLDESQLKRSLGPREEALETLEEAETATRGMGEKPAAPAKKAEKPKKAAATVEKPNG